MSDKYNDMEHMLQLTHHVLTDAVHTIGHHDLYVKDSGPRLIAEDMSYIRNRAQVEGASFFTKTLPLYGKRLDAALLTGVFDSRGFRNRATKSVLFGWLLDQILSTGDAVKAPVGCPIAVKLIRQLTYLFYKYELPYSHEQTTKVVDSFIETERELPDPSLYCDGPEDPLLALASNLIAIAVHRFNALEIIPKHGPGAVATGEKQWQKMRFARIYTSLEQLYPFTEWMCASMSHVADSYRQFEKLKVLEAGTAKVVLVPKDSRGPRLISCEPLEYQWIQQGISEQLVKLIESNRLTRGRVNFTDQEINRKHALWGSMGTHWVTLDMKDASDRVSLALVNKLFEKTCLLQYLLASRSTATKLPNGDVITMKKFAPMGSALCFPVEALVFWALGVASLHLNTGLKLSRALACVKVYGDDIITTAESCAAVICTYEKYHLKVNSSKCCTTGFFRESCGMDAYLGIDVTPIKIRSVWSSNPDCNAIVSLVASSNLLWAKGYHSAAEHLESLVRACTSKRIKPDVRKALASLPTVADENPRSYLVFHRPRIVDDFKGISNRYNPLYQRLEVKALVSQPLFLSRKRPGWELVFESLIGLEHRRGVCKAPGQSAPNGSTNVRSYPIRGRVSLKPRWCLK